MKKILALMICVLMLFSLAACADDNKNADNGTDGIVNEADKNADKGAADEGAVDKDTNGTNGTGTGAAGNQTLEGTAKGYGGDVKVTVEVNGKDIVSVVAVGEKETPGVGSKAILELPKKIEEKDSTEVEAVSGATVTSNAIKEAVNKALEGIK